MHRHKHYRHRHHSWKPFGGFFWLFLFAFFFLGGRWWPGILILIGLSMLLGALFREDESQRTDDLPPVQRPPAPVSPSAPAMTVTAAAVEPLHRADLLPADCPQCGGPVRLAEVRWTGKQSAACAWCGSSLPMKKG